MTELQVKKSAVIAQREELHKEVCDKFTILMAQGSYKPTKCMEVVASSMGMSYTGVYRILRRLGVYQKTRKYETKN